MSRNLPILCLILAIVCLGLAKPALSEEKSFCDDPEAKAEWQELIEKYPGSKNINVLHALRLGLCEKVNLGQLTVMEASTLFEKARASIIEDIEQKEQAEELEGIL